MQSQVMALLDEFRLIAGDPFVVTDPAAMHAYGHDETETLHYQPDIVIRPRTAEQVSAIMKLCNQHRIPVTPRGAGTGLSGGALPHLGGVVISTDRMNSILDIDEMNGTVTTEPGVITEVLQDAVKKKNLFYPLV